MIESIHFQPESESETGPLTQTWRTLHRAKNKDSRANLFIFENYLDGVPGQPKGLCSQI